MLLFDLPLEIYQEILDYTVIQLGHKSIQLRLVNRAFNHEILLAHARNRIPKADSWTQNSRLHKDFLVSYFLHQRRDDKNSAGTDIISLMNHWVDRLARGSTEGSERDERRYQYMKLLVSHAKHDLSDIVFAAQSGPIHFDPLYEFLFAATYNGDLELVNQLSQDTRRIRQDVESGLFEDRLIDAAIKSLDPKTVEMLLRRGAKVHPEGTDDESWHSPVVVAVEHWSPNMLQLLLLPEFGLRTSGLAYQHAITKAMSLNQADVLAMLLDHYTAPLSESRYLMTEGLREACRLGLIDIICLLLDNGADVNEGLNFTENLYQPRPLAYAGWKGQVEVMRLLLERGASIEEHGNRRFHGSPGGEAMLAVAWGGHYGAMQVLVDAGLRLGMAMWIRVMFILSFQPEAAKLARTILDDGHLLLSLLPGLDDDGDYSEDLADLVALACRHGNFEFLKALFDHGAPLNDDAIYTRRRYPPPIVMAMCWRQDALVEALRTIGADEVDPLQSIIGNRFQQGDFPRDPPSPPPCHESFSAAVG
ncbi:Ankyrin repeat protein [Aspergillus clavatus NRRL 1]|uniref:Ankyrin repeat protein n=1 Tax=Aspergillus clavatus (strain ATCC 1007 / CBS 513.65 / DSM 816 / NCTC 3887 / NRRL 1 / QM 1276 / 107) TaxID=344612 RepID=A1CCE3_ASPCL|nr:Ankyrin repeat protein [Aspergillus clavatus NRRL 1]EAW12200.1 Ankyrin repeat protein [Aspergillus clavatus NRRL 1]